MQLRVFLVITASAFVATGSALSQSREEMTQRGQEMVDEASSFFALHLGGEDKDTIRSIDFRVRPTGGRFCAGAGYAGTERVVELSTAFIAGAMLAGDVQALAAFGVIDSKQYEDYLSLMANIHLFKDFPIPDDIFSTQIDTWNGDHELLDKARSMGGLSTVAFVVAHEIAHHILGHTDRVGAHQKENLKWEIEADRWATQKSAEAAIAPIWAVSHMMVIRLRELYDEGEREEATHPAGEDRVIRMLEATAQFMTEQEKLMSSISEQLGVSGDQIILNMTESVQSLKDTFREFDTDDADELRARANNGDFYAFTKVAQELAAGSHKLKGGRERALYQMQMALDEVSNEQLFAKSWLSHQIGLMWEDGVSERLPKNHKQAIRYYRIAARIGFLPSIHRLQNSGVEIVQSPPKASGVDVGFSGKWKIEGADKVLYLIDRRDNIWSVIQPDAGPWKFTVSDIRSNSSTLQFRQTILYTDGSHPFSGTTWKVKLELLENRPGVLRMQELRSGKESWTEQYLKHAE